MSYSPGNTSFVAVRRWTKTRPSGSRAHTNTHRCRSPRAYASPRRARPTTRSFSSTTSKISSAELICPSKQPPRASAPLQRRFAPALRPSPSPAASPGAGPAGRCPPRPTRRPPACHASAPASVCSRSPRKPTPQAMPASGWAAVSAGSDLRRGAVSKALWTRTRPVTPSTTTAYGCQPVSSSARPPAEKRRPLTRVNASCTPYSRPAARASSVGPQVSRRRPALSVSRRARPSITPTISQCRSGSVTALPPRGSPARMNAVTPPASSASPAQPWRPSGRRVWMRERARAKSRLVASSGSTRVSSPPPSASAPSAIPATISPMPASQRGTRTRSSRRRGERKSPSGARWAAFCWRTKPKTRQHAAHTARTRTRTDTLRTSIISRVTGASGPTRVRVGAGCRASGVFGNRSGGGRPGWRRWPPSQQVPLESRELTRVTT
ncbi:hypothetical protein SVIOM342S_04782 [Streptomyces violaceorubidus]